MLGPVETVAEVDSTNRVLLDRAAAGAPEGAVLVADHQTAGRGRLGRTWEAEPGSSLLVSVLLRPALPPARAHLLTVAAALAARDACTAVAGATPWLKWPNDLVVEDAAGTRKLAGLLAESIVTGERLDAVVVGMGLNLRRSAALPGDAAALDELAGRAVDRDVLLGAWLERFDRRYAGLATDAGVDALAADHRAACSTLGREVRLELPGGALLGRAADITDDGLLVVDLPDGERRTVAVADVVHLRPA